MISLTLSGGYLFFLLVWGSIHFYNPTGLGLSFYLLGLSFYVLGWGSTHSYIELDVYM